MLMSFDFIIFALHDRNDAIWSMCLCVTAHWNQEAIESSEYKRVMKMDVTMVSSAFRYIKYQAFSHRFICRISFLLHHFFRICHSVICVCAIQQLRPKTFASTNLCHFWPISTAFIETDYIFRQINLCMLLMRKIYN